MIHHVFGAAIILLAVVASIRMRKLTLTAGVVAALTAGLVYAGAGYTGLGMLGAFFISGTFATSWKRSQKQEFDHETNHRGRNSGQVLANGGVAALAGLLAYLFPGYSLLFTLMMAAALAAATSDTLSSELGMIYGRRFYNIVTLKRDLPGRDGVISLEGTLAGIVGSLLIALVYASGMGFHMRTFVIIVITGTAGNIADSLLGATFERKRLLNNDAVNALNTLIAALLVLLF